MNTILILRNCNYLSLFPIEISWCKIKLQISIEIEIMCHDRDSVSCWIYINLMKLCETHFCSRQMSFEMLLILFAPKYKYFKFFNSSTASGKCCNKFPLKFNSRSPLDLADLKHLGNELFVSKLFLRISFFSGHTCNKSCGNWVNPFELRSNTRKLLKRLNVCDGNVAIKFWLSSTVSMSVNLLISCKCLKCSSKQSSVSPRRPKSRVFCSMISVSPPSLLSDP